MTKRTAASLAAEAMINARWRKTNSAERKKATQAARDARWPKCRICGEREGHSVHAAETEPGYRHDFSK